MPAPISDYNLFGTVLGVIVIVIVIGIQICKCRLVRIIFGYISLQILHPDSKMENEEILQGLLQFTFSTVTFSQFESGT
jgi:hypothetical protein